MNYTLKDMVPGTTYYWDNNTSDIYTLDKIDGSNYWRHQGNRPSEKSPNTVGTFLEAANEKRIIIVSKPSAYEIY